MPTSTAWLSRGTALAQRGTSPVRPSEEHIERLSPEPAVTPVHSSTPSCMKREANGHFLLGLGLSNTPLQERAASDTDGLYLDANGRAHLGAKVKSPRQDLNAGKVSRAPASRYYGPPKRSHPGHGRTPSAMSIDDLANAAIATSPQLLSSTSRPNTSYVHGYSQESNDRAAKRIKSERLYSHEFSRSEERPTSSREEDAELLLGLSRGFSFSRAFSSISASQMPVQLGQFTAEHNQSSPSLASKSPAKLKPPIDFGISNLDGASDDIVKSIETPKQAEMLPLEDTGTRSIGNSIDPVAMHKSYTSSTEDEEPAYTSTEAHPVVKDAGHNLEDVNMAQDQRDVPPSVSVSAKETPRQKSAKSVLKEPRRVPVEISQPVCPICNQINSNAGIGQVTTNWIHCDGSCDRWLHISCAGFSDHEVKKIAKFICKDCEPVYGQTQFARTSTRTRAAPDYAALNEGVTKPTEHTDTHPYVTKFRDGTIKYHKDSFARLRPELLTKELWENFDGMKRPFVVPSVWNPRFGKAEEPVSQVSPKQDDGGHDTPKSYVTISSAGEVLGESANLEEVTSPYTIVQEPEIDLDQDYLGMVMPRDLTVRKVADLVGPVLAPVIDVMSQQGMKKNPSLSEWADYYEDKQKKDIRNVISLEISHSRLGRLIRRPEVVRKIDLQDQVWHLNNRNPKQTATARKHVAFYCLMSVGDSFTDFHIDFGGSSVYYHILKGRKTFFFIPPTEKYLKKYEEWNDTANQNSIWLGDWCDGNVTRVDLFPGDTAFIPAGWIHSVWTPEDSLVIGGNFLTRYDLDMQLKVVNIERINGTALMFRYPSFQKVMWYTLIKYLLDDPVPQSVIDDFLDDPEYAYIRAFPVWHIEGHHSDPEFEPDEDELPTRTYTKSELRGLIPLRDYLYRTARIYADLPVKGKLDKSKNNAIKASVPKVYGDPMQLIREFAIFIAWIKGNETAPEWLHTDDDPNEEQDNKESTKKADSFRIPGERISTRRRARVSGSPGADSRATPDQDDKRESSVPKSLGPRVACGSCRKKRPQQSCRHATAYDETAQQTLERTRTYSNVSIDIARLARASPVVNSIEGPTAPLKQAPPVAPPAATSSVDEDTTELSTSSDTAPAFTTRMTSPFEQNNITLNGTPTTPNHIRDQNKKGRSKACEECRKSKRRCVHDEHGRVDPAKAAEPSKPRGSVSAKRPPRLIDEHPSKRVKLEDDYAVYGTAEMMIDPALMPTSINESMYGMHQNQPLLLPNLRPISSSPQGNIPLQSFIASGPVQTPSIEHNLDPALMDPALLEAPPPPVPAPVDRQEAPTPALPKLATAALAGVISSHTPDVDRSFSPITTEDAVSKAGSEEGHAQPTSLDVVDGQDHVSNEPYTNGVVRENAENIYHDDLDKNTKQSRASNIDKETQPKRELTPRPTRQRRSSSRLSHTIHETLTVQQDPKRMNRRPSTPRPALDIRPGVIETKTTPQMARYERAVSNSSNDIEEDASTRLARELQAQEHGLRRRPSMRTS